MHGFRQILTEYLRMLRPLRLLEWGPGLSTELMLEHAPEASIISVEHDEAWLARAKERFGSRVQFIHESCTNRHSRYAAVAYDHGRLDMAFVDGRRRVECCLIALQCLRPGGLVLLHDACRDRYMRPLRHYADIVEIRANTAVLRPLPHRHHPTPT
jgi:predicted O-methyltransferase YrrM